MAVAQEASSAVRLEPAASAAAEQLFERHSGWIYGYCLRLLRSPEEAEDAVQATYLNACRSLNDGFRPRADSAWLLRVAQNVCLTRLRSSGRRARLERLEDAEILAETVAAPDRNPDDLIGLPEALATLPAQQRQAILLREWQGLSYKEVADELGLSQSAVEALIFRARRSLASELETPKRERRRALHGLDVGGLAAALKGLVGGATAIKLATVAAVATTATVLAADPVGWHRPSVPDPAPAPKAAPKAPSPVAPAAAGIAVAVTQTPSDPAERRFYANARGKAVKAGGPGHGRANGHGKEKAGQGHGQARGRAKMGKPKATGKPASPGKSAEAQVRAAASAPAHASARGQVKPKKS